MKNKSVLGGLSQEDLLANPYSSMLLQALPKALNGIWNTPKLEENKQKENNPNNIFKIEDINKNPVDEIKLQNSPNYFTGQFDEQFTSSFHRGIDVNHVLASNALQNIGMFIGNNLGNSYQNALLDFQNNQDPNNYLPKNPNTSKQNLYGMEKGGLVQGSEYEFTNEQLENLKQLGYKFKILK